MFGQSLITETDVFHRLLNLPVRERFDPLLLSIAGMLGSQAQTAYCLLQFAVLSAGCILLFRRGDSSSSESLIKSVAVVLGVIITASLDPFSLKLHWFPFLVYALDCSRAERRSPGDGGIKRTAGAVIPIIFWWLTAGTLGVFGALLAPVVRTVIFQDKQPGGKLYPFITAAVIAGSIVFMPVYHMPPFPGDARLAPISPLSLYGFPAIGPYLQPLPVIYPSYRLFQSLELLRLVGLLLGYAGLFLLFSAIPEIFGLFPSGRKLTIGSTVLNQGGWGRLLVPAFVVLLVTFLLVEPPFLAAHGLDFLNPYPAMRDLVPGLALEPLPWLIVPFGAMLSSFMLAARATAGQSKVILAILCISLLSTKILTAPLESHLHEEFFGPQAARSGNPSGFVGQVYGGWIFNEKRGGDSDSKLMRYALNTDLKVSAQASVHPEDAHLSLDWDHATRWGTRRPQQPGDWMLYTFDRAAPIVRATLSIRNLPSDFPRGLKVEGSRDGVQFFTIYDFPDWYGPVEWTPAGQPYFGPQSKVVVEFAEPIELRAIRFTETMADPSFDWSIGELILWGPRADPAKPADDDDDDAATKDAAG